MVSCKDCGKEFDSRMSMEQHHSAKHSKPKAAPVAVKKSSKKLIFAIAAVVVIALIGYFVFASGSDEKPTVTSDNIEVNLGEIPKRPIHWHPKLTIVIKGEQQRIPPNLGAEGSVHYPVHTHEDLPLLHYEVNRPTAENMVLGYFFSTVWKKTFNRSCIFEYCSGPDGNLTMTVNGQPNYQFDKYIPKDEDDIVIRFE